MNKNKKILIFSNLAIQMGFIIGLGVFLGNYIDKQTSNKTLWWTLILLLFSVFLGLYYFIKAAKKNG